jgi:hypothetical protein
MYNLQEKTMTDHEKTTAWLRVTKHLGVTPDSDPLPSLRGLNISELIMLQTQIMAQINAEIQEVASR